MKTAPMLFRITGIVVFIQILLGGLLTFNFIDSLLHIVTGIVLFILAITTMIATLVSKPTIKPLREMSVGLVVLIFIQGILGFSTLSNGNQLIAWIHFLVAMGIYGMAISGTFMSMRPNQSQNTPMKNQVQE